MDIKLRRLNDLSRDPCGASAIPGDDSPTTPELKRKRAFDTSSAHAS